MNQQNFAKSSVETVENEVRKETNIDFRGIFFTLLYRWWIIVSAMIVAVVAAFLFSYFQKPLYASSAKLFITGMSVTSEEQSPNSNTQSTAASLAKSLQDMVKDRNILNEVSDNLEAMGIVNPDTGKKYTYEELISSVTVLYSSDKPQILTIRTTSSDKNVTREMTNMVQEVAAKKLTETSLTKVNLGNTAGTGGRTNDNMLRNMVIAAFTSALVAIIGILIAFFSDDKIKTAEDVEKYLGLSVLGQIPISERISDADETEFEHKKRKKKERTFQ